MSQPNDVIGCTDLGKTYADGAEPIEVLRSVTLSLARGESLAIVGESGSGKSTLLHLLGGLDRPTTGSVLVLGQAITDLSVDAVADLRNRALGFVYQFHHLLPEFTAVENVAMPLRVRGIGKALAESRARDILGEVGLSHRISHRPAELSGGERQRCAIARAVVGEPACVLADEPTGNLDARTSALVLEQMIELNASRGTALIVVTHDPAVAGRMGHIKTMTDGLLCD